ncbi:predicted protein [Histoplasma mississippiense (nom. inval.)]|uniref:predicted protein n=1 Tax=Ajellomyces capsulatus (strain NAm1 / WU24) TaxID=2059318 RepID=UPI000157BFC1|nr:predicted protein [Histoplasma mississippiense (nom. inval.)]EDN06397.1 predicted protein [Histoplasma mississippiense (nom. inval.)]
MTSAPAMTSILSAVAPSSARKAKKSTVRQREDEEDEYRQACAEEQACDEGCEVGVDGEEVCEVFDEGFEGVYGGEEGIESRSETGGAEGGLLGFGEGIFQGECDFGGGYVGGLDAVGSLDSGIVFGGRLWDSFHGWLGGHLLAVGSYRVQDRKIAQDGTWKAIPELLPSTAGD